MEHAYGEARGVPDMIDALSSPDRDDREWGKQALAASINHQGSVYSASGRAVPFLVKLVERDDIEDRAWILELLAGIAVGERERRSAGTSGARATGSNGQYVKKTESSSAGRCHHCSVSYCFATN